MHMIDRPVRATLFADAESNLSELRTTPADTLSPSEAVLVGEAEEGCVE